MTALLPGFEYRHVDVDGVSVNCAIAGSGPPVLMLHGYPQNHLMWRDVAPALAEDHTIVLADLRGYGDSGKPDPDAAGEAYSKRSMARDQVGLMRRLGSAGYSLKAGTTRAVAVRLSKAARRNLRRRHRMKVTAAARGNHGTVTRTVVLQWRGSRHR